MKKLLALVLALVMSMSLVTISNAAFKDADKIDYDEAVEVMNAIGVLVGDEKGNFNAKENLTREQAAKIISYLLLGNKTAEALVGAAKFTDVAATRWSAGFVDYCASTGVVAGNGNGTFAPAGQLTGFQFAKMLLVALGYDAKIEGFTGTDWQINVSKVANQVGLFNGLSISGTAVLTREQGAQMCLNTLKAPLVEYTNKGGNITINGTVIGIGASNAQYVTTTLAREQRISDRTLTNTDTNTKGGYTVEFGEKYYPALELKTDSDDFDRPAHQWLHNNKKIGSYVDYDLMVAEYTTAIDGKELYEKLGSSIIKEYTTTYYVDGQVDDTIKTGNMIKTNTRDYETTGNGVLTQVFVNDDRKDITIVSINTYIAQAVADYNTKKETLSFASPDETKFDKALASSTLSVEDFPAIADMKADDLFLITMAETSTNKFTVQSVAAVEKLENKDITKFTKESKLTTDGTEYKYSKKGTIWNELGTTYNVDALDKSYNVYLDQYGYVIATEIYSDTLKYLFMTGYDLGTSHLSIKTADAAVIFTDGTMSTVKVNVKDTNENISEKNDQLVNGDSQYNKWFSYTEKNGVYTLKPVTVKIDSKIVPATINVAADDEGVQAINSAKVRLTDSANDKIKAYGNDDSIYITVETGKVWAGSNYDKSDIAITKVTGTYTGVQNIDLKIYEDLANDDIYNDETYNLLNKDFEVAPKTNKVSGIDKNEVGTGVFALYNSKGYVIAAIVVGEDNTSSDNYAYALKAAQNEYKSGDYYYWDFIAVVNGKVETLTVKSEYDKAFTKNGTANIISENIGADKGSMFKLTYDKDGYVIGAKLMDDDQAKVYGNTEAFGTNPATQDTPRDIDPEKDKIYNVDVTKDAKLRVTGRTLYLGGLDDYGLTLATGAPVIVAQDEVYTDGDKNFTYAEYTTFAQALSALNDSDKFEGWVSAVLNGKGTAEYVVINSADAIGVTTEKDPGTTTGDVAKVELKVKNSEGLITLYGKNGKPITEKNEYSFELWQYAQGQDNYVLVDEGTYTYGVTPAFATVSGNSYYVVVDGVESNIARG